MKQRCTFPDSPSALPKQPTNGFILINSEERGRQYPETWSHPTEHALDSICPGDTIKVGVEGPGMTDVCGERFWTLVLDVLDTTFLVEVDDVLLSRVNHGLKHRDKIIVGRQDVIEVYDGLARSTATLRDNGVPVACQDSDGPRSSDEHASPAERTVKCQHTGPMTLDHRQWADFMERLYVGCDVRFDVHNGENSMTWTCDGAESFPASRSILVEMGLTPEEIERSIAYFEKHGGHCDCEVFLNVDDSDPDYTEASLERLRQNVQLHRDQQVAFGKTNMGPDDPYEDDLLLDADSEPLDPTTAEATSHDGTENRSYKYEAQHP